MGRLHHRTAPGCTYLVTTKTWENCELFRVHQNAEIVVECILAYRDRGVYLLHEFVVMPNHVHLVLTPNSRTTLEKVMQFIKGGSSHQMHQKRGHKMQIWQPGFHESTIRDADDFKVKRNYIRMNPVEARLVVRPEDWRYGSASGIFALDPLPNRLSSGAEAPSLAAASVVGAKAPTP